MVALAAVETSSIAQGTLAADAMLKTADVTLLEAGPLSPGKYWVLIGGDVAPVRAAHARGVDTARDTLLDQLLLPQLHDGVLPALRGLGGRHDHDALGIIETLTAAAAIVAADAALKTAAVALRDLRLANGLGGKGVLWITGDVASVQAALDSGVATARAKGLLARSGVIPRLHADLKARMFGS